MENPKKLSALGISLIIFSLVFGFNNPAIAFYKMGYGSIFFYILAAMTFFVPLAFMVVEYSSAFKDTSGGMYSWMEKTKGGLYGFMAIFVWYFGMISYLATTSVKIWIPMSAFLFGEDSTKNWSVLNLNSTQFVGVLAITFTVAITFLATKGFNKIAVVAKIGGFTTLTINAIFYLTSLVLLAVSKGEMAHPIEGVTSFFKPQNPEGVSAIALLGFVVFAIFAYGGLECIGSLAEKAKTIKTFTKGILLAAVIISLGYSLSIFCFGISSSSIEMVANKEVNLGNIVFVLMGNLGYKIGTSLGLAQDSAIFIGTLFTKAVGLSIFLAYIGAFSTVIYAPLKSLLDGSPEGLLPKTLTKKNSKDMPQNAMWLQGSVICILIAIVSFGGQAAKAFYDIVISMANVAVTVPYLFLIFAFPTFKKNFELESEHKIFKNNSTAYLVSFIAFGVVFFGNLFTVIQPLFEKSPNVLNTVTMAAGPILFGIIAAIIYKNYEKKSKVSE